MAGRALVKEAELRRWAKIAREEGVSIQSRFDPAGGVTIRMVAAQPETDAAPDNLRDLITDFGSM